MSMLDKKIRCKNGAFWMMIVTLFCLLFSSIYNHYGHGVYSNYMSYMFLIPFLSGVLPYGVLAMFIKAKDVSRFSYNSYNSGIATLIIGSMLKGIFEIAGTNSPYLMVYLIAGMSMLIIGAISYFLYPDQGEEN